jgi:hypothetical protein
MITCGDLCSKCGEQIFTIAKKVVINIPVIVGAEICLGKACALDEGEANNSEEE